MRIMKIFGLGGYGRSHRCLADLIRPTKRAGDESAAVLILIVAG